MARELRFDRSTTDGMHFILVPFLLGVRLAGDEDRWQNGPEYTFHATIGTISNLYEDQERYMGSSLFTVLKCRPREPEYLQCRFEGTKIAKLTPDTFRAEAAIPPADVTYSEFDFGNKTFEMKFNDKGIESYAFEQDDPPFGYFFKNMYRLVANHLSVWSRIRTVRRVEKLENSTVGECFVAYKVSQKRLENGAGPIGDFVLTWLPGETMDPEITIEISKEIHLNDCIPHPVYRFGTRYNYGVVPVESIESLRSSIGHMYISSGNFSAESVNVVNVYDLNREMIGSAIDRIRLTLVSVEAAQTSLDDIPRNASFGPTLYEDLRNCFGSYDR